MKPEADPDEASGGVRLDIWLWAARFFRTRSLAKQAIEGGKIDVNGSAGKPAKRLHVGDALHISRGDERFELSVLGLSEQRGPASVAQRLHAETERSVAERERNREQRRAAGAGYLRPPTRPDKRSRRLIKRFKDSV